MRRFLQTSAILLLAGLGALPVAAQTQSLVSGTIVDSNGVPYAGAKVQFSLVSVGGPSPSLTPCTNPQSGCPIQNPGAVIADPTGSFQLNLWTTASITPSTTYSLQVTISPGVPPPFGTGPQTFTLTGLVVTGPTMSLTASIATVPPPALTVLTGSNGTPAPLQDAISLALKCGSQPNCFQLTGLTQQAIDATTTNGSKVVTTTNPFFTSNMVGWNFAAFQSCSTGSLLNFPTYAGGTSEVTITAVNSSTSAMISSNATGGTAGATCIFVGLPQDSAFASAAAAVASYLTSCPNVVFPQGVIWLANPSQSAAITTEPLGCQINGIFTGISNGGTLMVVQGKGEGATQLFLDPFAWGNFSTNFSAGSQEEFKDWSVTQGGYFNSGGNYAGNSVVLANSFAFFDHWGCVNVGGGVINFYGINATGNGGINGIALHLDACGSILYHDFASMYPSRLTHSTLADALASAVSMSGGTLRIDNSQIDAGPGTAANEPLILMGSAGVFRCELCHFTANGSASAGLTIFNNVTNAGGFISVTDSEIQMAGAATQGGVSCSLGCTANLTNNRWTLGASGYVFTGTASGETGNDLCGNILVSGAGFSNVSGGAVFNSCISSSALTQVNYAFTNKNLASNVSVAANTTTTVDSIAIPSASFAKCGTALCRIRVSYSYYVSGGVNGVCWATDGTNVWRPSDAGVISNNQGICNDTFLTPATYSSGAGVTITLQINDTGVATVCTTTAGSSPCNTGDANVALPSGLQVEVVPSN